MKPRYKTEMMAEVVRQNSQQRRRDIIVQGGYAESNVGLFVEEALDERLQYARDILHEVARDGCVQGEFS